MQWMKKMVATLARKGGCGGGRTTRTEFDEGDVNGGLWHVTI